MDWSKIKHFKKSEFTCKCGCNRNEMNEEFMLTLDAIREDAGVPMAINSGYRCPEHDVAEGGKGNHPSGKAADVATPSSRARFLIHSAAVEAGIRRIGIDRTFLHLDMCNAADDDAPEEVEWLY